MRAGITRETFPGERRVALIPSVLPSLVKAGFEFLVEEGAGEHSGFSDDEYKEAGATIASRSEVFLGAEILGQVRAYGANLQAGRGDLSRLQPGQMVAGFCEPLAEPCAAEEVARTGAILFSMELVPRIARAQGMDALSSMATIAGYKAVLIAAERLPRMFPLMMTAAGTVAPAKVLVIGAGVAGLQAIATARRLGAVVHAYDVRPAVKEQVESLGARFLELSLAVEAAETAGGYARGMSEDFYRHQSELLAGAVAESDVVITTAAIPGRKAPVLVSQAMVQRMRFGSVIVDLAAERGGNCELTRPGVVVEQGGVTIAGPVNLPSSVPYHASQMYSRNIGGLLRHIAAKCQGGLDLADEIIAATLVTHDRKVIHPQVREALQQMRSAAGKGC